MNDERSRGDLIASGRTWRDMYVDSKSPALGAGAFVCLSVCLCAWLRAWLSLATIIPSTGRTTLGDRAFPVTAARAWNALPSSVRSAPSSLLQFRRDLKTALHVSLIVLLSSCVTDCNF